MSYWAIVQTHSMRESVAAYHLARRGYGTYLPQIAEERADVAPRRQLVPLFPSYLFVRIKTVWYPVLSTVGVMRLLRNGGNEPSRVDPALLEEIRAREVGGVVRIPVRPLLPGDRVRILRGSFRD